MLRQLVAFVLALVLAGAAAHADAQQWAADAFQTLCYHDVRADPSQNADRYTVGTAQLVQHFAWLKENGYHVVSLDDVAAARAGRKPLPEKAVLLTFDDGYRSFYTQVFPLLKAYKYPAVLALVGSWLSRQKGEEVPYEEGAYRREDFLSWDEIRELAASGLVEIASHTYDLHHGVLANPQGNELPAAITHIFDAATGKREHDNAYVDRIEADLRRNSELIARETGKRPRAIVWPYGRYNATTAELAHKLGMPLQLTLDDGLNDAGTPLDRMRRILLAHNPTVGELASALRPPLRSPPVRVVHVDLDYVYDADGAQQERNLGALLDRVKELGVNTVFLQAYSDPDGDGAADALYFPNRHLPMRADLFSRVSWQLQTRAGVKVFAWMPLLAFRLPDRHPLAARQVVTEAGGARGYARLTPFDPDARKTIAEIYDDLAKYAVFQGLLFHDDATLSDYEDASAQALAHYAREWKLPASVGAIRSRPEELKRWSRLKARYLTEFSLELAARVRAWQPNLRTARNLYARVALDPSAETWFAQSFDDFLASYDLTAVMAMPYMEGAGNARAWMHDLVREVAARPHGLSRSLFELQATDWRTRQPVASDELAETMHLLQKSGALNFGYYPDDFLKNHPDVATIKPWISLQTFPYRNRR